MEIRKILLLYFFVCLPLFSSMSLTVQKEERVFLKKKNFVKKKISFISLISFFFIFLILISIITVFFIKHIKRKYSYEKDEENIFIEEKKDNSAYNRFVQNLSNNAQKNKNFFNINSNNASNNNVILPVPPILNINSKSYFYDSIIHRMTIFSDKYNKPPHTVIFVHSYYGKKSEQKNTKPFFQVLNDKNEQVSQKMINAMVGHIHNRNLFSKDSSKNKNDLSIETFVNEIVNVYFGLLFFGEYSPDDDLDSKGPKPISEVIKTVEQIDQLVKDNVQNFLTFILCKTYLKIAEENNKNNSAEDNKSKKEEEEEEDFRFFTLNKEASQKKRKIYLNSKNTYQKKFQSKLKEIEKDGKRIYLTCDEITKEVSRGAYDKFRQEINAFFFPKREYFKEIEIDFSRIKKEFDFFCKIYYCACNNKQFKNDDDFTNEQNNTINAFYEEEIEEEIK